MSLGRSWTPKMNTLEMRTRLYASVGDRYHIERTLGEGDLAIAYLARDRRDGKTVVMKVLRANVASALGSDTFLNATRIGASLSHPNIIPLLDAGDGNGMLFYVIPGVEGHSLRDVLSAYGQIPAVDAVRIVADVASALDYAHARDVVHRDIRPENITLQDGRALVADFGIANALASIDRDANAAPGLSVGALAYMSPEQAAGELVDGRSDLYSLASTLYEMLVGEPPFTGPTVQAVVAKRFVRTPESVAAISETIPPLVARALQRALARAAGDRPATAGAFVRSLTDPDHDIPQAGMDASRSAFA